MAILHRLWSVWFLTFIFALLTILQLQSSSFQKSQSHKLLTALFTKYTNLTPKVRSRNKVEKHTSSPHATKRFVRVHPCTSHLSHTRQE